MNNENTFVKLYEAVSTNPVNSGWTLIDWDGNPALKLKCWRKKFGHGHVSVGVGKFMTIVYSFGANSDSSYSSTRWRPDGNHLSEQQAMDMVDQKLGKRYSYV